MRFSFLIICLAGLFLHNALNAVAADNTAVVNHKAASATSPVKGVEKMIAGPVVSVNVDKKEITIARNGNQYRIVTDVSTRVMSGREPVTLDKIKAGDAVIITYLRYSDGGRTALKIEDKSIKEEAVAKKAEATAEHKAHATAVPKTDVIAEPKKETSAAPKGEVKGEPRTNTPSASKAEAKTEQKKDAVTKDSLAAKVPVKTKN